LLLTNTNEVYDATLIDKSVEPDLRRGTQGFVFVDIGARAAQSDDAANRPRLRDRSAPRVYIERINIVGNTRTRDEVIRANFGSPKATLHRVLADRSRTRVRALASSATLHQGGSRLVGPHVLT